MRSLFVLLTGLLLTQASIAKADYDHDVDEADFVSNVDSAYAADTVPAGGAAGWNRWTCTAHGGPFQLRIFRGASYYFRAGSGEGQEAKRIAQKIAVRSCEFAGINGCTSGVAKCTVESN